MPVFENKVTVESDVKRHVGTRRQPSSSTGTGSTNICRQSFYGGQDVATDHRPDSVFWRKHGVLSPDSTDRDRGETDPLANL